MHQSLGEFRKYYRDINNGEIYHYLADGCRIDNRHVVAICVKVSSNSMALVLAGAFRSFFLPANPLEVTAALNKSRQTARQKPATLQIPAELVRRANYARS